MNDFEKTIAATLDAYREEHLLYADMMPVPMVRTPGGWAHSRKSPFDVYGISPIGLFVGAELKQSKRKESLPVRSPNKKGDGLQFHQLEALAEVVRLGGLAYLLWNNEGEIGKLTGVKIINAYEAMRDAVTARERGHKLRRNQRRSIPWESFESVPIRAIAGKPIHDWYGNGYQAGNFTGHRRAGAAGEDMGQVGGSPF